MPLLNPASLPRSVLAMDVPLSALIAAVVCIYIYLLYTYIYTYVHFVIYIYIYVIYIYIYVIYIYIYVIYIYSLIYVYMSIYYSQTYHFMQYLQHALITRFLAEVFCVLRFQPPPFMILDEVDAPPETQEYGRTLRRKEDI